MSGKRIVFAHGKQREMLLNFVSRKNISQLDAAKILCVPRSSFRNWIHETRTLPEEVFTRVLHICPDLKIYSAHVCDVLDADWGRRKGGQKCYVIVREKYGDDEFARRRSAGGRNSIKRRLELIKERLPHADDARVLELLGALIGDGWIGISGGRKQVCYCGDISQQAYAKHLQKLLHKAFHVGGYLKLRRKFSTFYIIVNSSQMFDFFKERFDFPIGQKKRFNSGLLPSEWEKAASVIRGIFDTDGSIYFDKARGYAQPYPIIEITSHNPELLDWIAKILAEKCFKVIRLKYSVRLKAVRQAERWFNEIKPSNSVHIQKWNRWRNQYCGPV